MNEPKNDKMLPPGKRSPVLDRVLNRIEGEQIAPTSKWVFLCQSGGLRLIWVISILVGAVAVAVSLFSFLHSGYAYYEATHEDAYTFVVETLPYVWFVVLLLMLLAAVYNFRMVGHGYRYSLSFITGSSVVLSLFGGFVLHVLGVGQLVDTQLAGAVPIYHSRESRELAMWQQPEDGRLVGMLHGFSSSGPSTEIIFEDVSGQPWFLDTPELEPSDMELLLSAEKVRLMGVWVDDDEGYQFHVCGVFPWSYNRTLMPTDFSAQRQTFVDRMHSRIKPLEKIADEVEETMLGESDSSTTCADLELYQRISQAMN